MYEIEAVKPLLVFENNAILYKRLSHSMLDMEKIIVSHSIVYVISGKVDIQTPQYDSFSVKKGEMLFMSRDSYLISDYVKEEEEMEVYLFFFDHEISSEFLRHVNTTVPKKKSTVLKLKTSNNILNYISALKDVQYKDKKNLHLLKSKLFEFLHLVAENNQDFTSTLKEKEAQSTQTDIQSYMLKHYDKNLSINDWASLSGLSLSTFNRKFKKSHQLSPKKWIIQQNMRLAHEALKNGARVSECAADFGYANTSNFIKTFKKIYKSTPKQLSMT